MSGFHDGAMVGWGQEDGRTAFLDKPFSPSTLVDVVRRLLAPAEVEGMTGGPRDETS
jgi:FixJ family two-component response regulator